MKTRFSDKGFDVAEKRLKQAGKDCINAGAAGMQREAQRLAPVDSGHLRRSIVLVPRSDGADVIATADYAIYVERGTGRFTPGGRSTPWVYPIGNGEFRTTTGMPAQPFMAPALDVGVDEFRKAARRRGLA